jgi:hypothetical protein
MNRATAQEKTTQAVPVPMTKTAGRTIMSPVFSVAGEMVWTGGLPLGLFTGRRTFGLTPLEGGTVEFTMHLHLSGLLSPLIARSLGDRQPDIDALAAGLRAGGGGGVRPNPEPLPGRCLTPARNRIRPYARWMKPAAPGIRVNRPSNPSRFRPQFTHVRPSEPS